MLPEPTMEKLHAMKLNGMAEAWEEQRQQPHSSDLSFDDRLALLVERQWIWKENRALATRLQYAHLKQTACLEDTTSAIRAASSGPPSTNWPRVDPPPPALPHNRTHRGR